jgi:His-Xaa-Ser system radical SAM maturase HxsC
MIPLRARSIKFNDAAIEAGATILRLSTNAERPLPLRRAEAFVALREEEVPPDFGWYVNARLSGEMAAAPSVELPPEFGYLGDGDVIAIEPHNGLVRVLFRKASHYNHFLLTERCNNNCLMCSQPPRKVDDGWIVDEILQALPLIDRGACEVGFTGGEPTLLGERFIELVRATESFLPNTSLHILSNGRSFADDDFAAALAGVRHHDLMIGIPLYSDLPHLHDYVVQADGAFDETVRGVLNLKRHGVRIEIRIVLQRPTTERLPQLARFIARNLLFADHVALMGLEVTGFARANLDRIWIDPVDYQAELLGAAGILGRAGIRTSIYNSQLCVLPEELRPLARRSISDWKQEYLPECDACSLKTDCAGFFATSGRKYSRGIAPILSGVSAHAGVPENVAIHGP